MSRKRSRKLSPQTVAVIGAGFDDWTGASAPDIVMSNNFAAGADMPFSAEALGADTPLTYTRWDNPNINRLEAQLAVLEGGEAAVCFASGMAAANGLLAAVLAPGDHMLVGEVVYPGVLELSASLAATGIAASRVDMADPAAVAAAMRPNTRLVHIESPANPILKLTDIRAIAAIAKGQGARLSVDSTFATPAATRPLELGADLVLHSLSKYLGGHGDSLGGAVIGRAADLVPIRKKGVIHMGGVISPFNAWLISRGLASFHLRMPAHADNALKLARWLEDDGRIEAVYYPGLASHPQADLARRQMDSFSGMIAFRTREGGRDVAARLADRLRVIHYAVSLGHHRSLIFYVATDDMQRTTYRFDEAGLARYRDWAGDGVCRFSVGLEDPGDLIADLDAALG